MSAGATARPRWREAVLLLSAVLSSGGCVAAGVAASPVISALQLVTDRSLERPLPAEMSLAWVVSVDVLERMGFRVDRLERDAEPRVIEASADGITVTARLSRMTPSMTRLSLRVESGGLTADKDTAEAIAGQVLARVNSATNDEARDALRAVDGLRHELRQLRSTMDQGRVSPAPAPAAAAGTAAPRTAPAAPGFTLGAPAIVVPTGYGFEAPPGTATTTSSATWNVGSAERLDPSPVTSSPAREIQAVPLAPVNTLVPVPGFTTPSSQR